MQFKNALLGTVLLLSISAAAIAQNIESFLPDYINSDQYFYRKMQEKIWDGIPKQDQKGWKFIKRWEYFWGQRLYPDGKLTDAVDIYAKYQNLNKNKKENSLESSNWTILGPINSPEGNGNREQGLGRINVVRFHPQNPDEIWVGAACGGVWKTTNKGATWTNFPFTQFLSLGVSDIAISYSNPNIVYVATGDADGSAGSGSAFYSIGLIKSTNGGQDWAVTNLKYEMNEGMIIYRVIVKPNDPNNLVVSTSKGVYKSIDGGENWNKVLDGNIRDLEFKPNDYNIQYCCTYIRNGDNTIYKSLDAGETWTSIHTITGANRVAMNVTAAAPNYLYILCSSSRTNGFHSFRIIDQTDNSSTVMSEVESSVNIMGWYGGTSESDSIGQGPYDLCLAISPTDENLVFTGGVDVFKTSNMGTSWRRSSNWMGGSRYVHADHHDLQYNPLTNELYSTNDGGISYSNDGGNTWTDISNGLSIMQFYRMGQSITDPNMIIAGAQDNGTNKYQPEGWIKVGTSDGMDCAVNPYDKNIIYTSIYNGSFNISYDGGETSDYMVSSYITSESGGWVTPIAIDYQEPENVYIGYQNVWKNTNFGGDYQWTKISDFNSSSEIDVLTVAKSNNKYIYATKESQLYCTNNGGTTWTTLKSFSKQITSVIPHPLYPEIIYVTLSGYTPNEKVYYYDGEAWHNLSGNLPNIPVNTLVYQSDTDDRVYIGTDIGVFYTDRNSNIWTSFNGDNLPNVIVNELEIYYGTGTPRLRAATYGRGLWETPIVKAPETQGVNLNIKNDTTVCFNDNFKLIAPTGYDSYLWTNGETTRELFVKESGEYSLLAIKNNIPAYSASYEVIVDIPPSLNINYKEAEVLCVGDTLELSATLGFKVYNWSNGLTDRKIQITESGKYWVKATKTSICESYSDTLEFIFLPKLDKPVITANGNILTASIDAESYQWYQNDIPIDGANNKTLLIDTDAKYTVEVTNSNSCPTLSDVFESTLSISESNSIITLSPNPGNGEFTLTINGRNGSNIDFIINNTLGEEIYNFSGKVVSDYYKSNIYLINQPAGVYFLKYSCGSENGIIKIIKK